MEDLEDAIVEIERAISLTNQNDMYYASCLATYADCLKSRYQRTGSVAALEQSLVIFERAASMDKQPKLMLGSILSNYACALRNSFELTGSMAEFDQGVTINELATSTLRTDMPHRQAMSNRVLLLGRKYERSGSVEDVTNAIAAAEYAVSVTPTTDPSCAIYCSNLLILLHGRFMRTDSMNDLLNFISEIEKALALTRKDEVSRSFALRLSHLNRLLLARFKKTNAREDLNHAIDAIKRAIDVTPSDDVVCAKHLTLLGMSLETRYRSSSSALDLDCAIEAYELAASKATGPSTIRIDSLVSAARLLKNRNIARAKVHLENAVKIFPLISPRTLQQSDRQYNLSSPNCSFSCIPFARMQR